MKTIYKYPLELTDEQTVLIPKNHTILTAQVQHGNLCLWARVDTDQELEGVLILVIGTGNPFPQNAGMYIIQYLSTVQLLNGGLVFHVFVAKTVNTQNQITELFR